MIDYYKELEGHQLSQISEDPPIFVLSPNPAQYIMSITIAFIRGQICIFGDYCPGIHGVVSTVNYGVDWFAGSLSPDYLCSKFLRDEWSEEQTFIELKAQLDYEDDPKIRESIIEFIDCYEGTGDGLSQKELYEWYKDTYGTYDDPVGFGYNLRDAGILCAIQRRFSELYPEIKNPPKDPNHPYAEEERRLSAYGRVESFNGGKHLRVRTSAGRVDYWPSTGTFKLLDDSLKEIEESITSVFDYLDTIGKKYGPPPPDENLGEDEDLPWED